MSMKNLLMIPVLGLLTVGCAVNAPIQGRADPYQASQIHFASDGLRNDTAVGRPILTRNESDLLVVTIPVRSAVDHNIHVEYRVTFFDAAGVPIYNFGWFPKTLIANTPDQVVVNSTDKRAADFQVDFRETR